MEIDEKAGASVILEAGTAITCNEECIATKHVFEQGGKDAETEATAEQDCTMPVLYSWVEIYVRGGCSEWKTLQVDQFGDFDLTLKTVYEALYDQPCFEGKIHSDLQLNLVGGGIVERNQVIMEGDKLIAAVYEPR